MEEVVVLANKTVENTIEISMLYDFYGELLTRRQKEVLQYYYEENYSLSEIADELGVSRQAVHDTIHKAEKSLRTYEEKLGIVERFRCTEADIEKAGAAIDQVIAELSAENESDHKQTVEKLVAVKRILSRLEE
jgi:predicted DNA-binding protein YlxM (UPF0122 family)